MSHRDVIYYSEFAPTPGTDYIRPLWYVIPGTGTIGNDLWIWNNTAGRYTLFIPDVTVPPVAGATEAAAGIIALATAAAVLAGTDAVSAVTPATLAAALNALKGNAPSGLNTLAALAAAVGNAPTFSQDMSDALGTKANANGSNVSTPALSAVNKLLVNTEALKAVLLDVLATPSDLANARSSVDAAGATSAAGVQRVVSLPALDTYTKLKERTIVGAPAGTNSPVTSDDDVILLDGAAGVATAQLGNPSLYKAKRYHFVCVNFTHVPRIAASTGFIDGPLTFVFTGVGQSLTVIPTGLGKWAKV